MKTISSLLIVDDNSFDVEIAQRILMRTGRFKHVYSVSDGREALNLFVDYEASRAKYPEQFPPLVILLDINMPVLDGFGFLDAYARLQLPEERKSSIVIMLTSSNGYPDRERALAHSVVADYIVKPLTMSHATTLAERLGRLGE
jgi:CheY-like chemotaxis protein